MRTLRRNRPAQLLLRLFVLLVVLSLMACTHRRRRGGGGDDDDDDDATEVGDDDDTGIGDDDDTDIGDDDDDSTPGGVLGSNCLAFDELILPFTPISASWTALGPVWELTGGLYIDYEFEVFETVSVQIDLIAEGQDPILYILGPDCSIFGSDDDGGDGLNSRYTSTALEPGIWTVVAAPLDGRSEGDFTLSLSIL